MEKLSINEIEELEAAMTAIMRVVKRPAYWEKFQDQAKVNIDRPAAAILHILYKHECQFQSLVNQIGLEAPSISRKVHELEDRGLIERRPTADKRIHELYLSQKAKKIVEQLEEAKRSIMSEVLSSWTKEEKNQLIAILQRLSNNMSDYFEHQEQLKDEK